MQESQAPESSWHTTYRQKRVLLLSRHQLLFDESVALGCHYRAALAASLAEVHVESRGFYNPVVPTYLLESNVHRLTTTLVVPRYAFHGIRPSLATVTVLSFACFYQQERPKSRLGAHAEFHGGLTVLAGNLERTNHIQIAHSSHPFLYLLLHIEAEPASSRWYSHFRNQPLFHGVSLKPHFERMTSREARIAKKLQYRKLDEIIFENLVC